MTTAKQETHQSSSKPIVQADAFRQTDTLIQAEKFSQPDSLNLNEPSSPENISQDNPASIQINQKKLSDLHDSLEKIIGVMPQNQSILSRISAYWGELPLWIKIGTGLALIVPTLVIGIVFNIWFLVAVSAFTLITYTLVSLLLDNHHNNSTSTLEGLREGITSLGNVLISVIDSLEIIKQQFSQAINDMVHENEKLKENVNTLTQQVNSLTQTVGQLQITELGLRAVHSGLEATSAKITQTLEEQTQLVQASQSELNQAAQDFKSSQSQLAEKVIELDLVKQEMALKFKQYQGICNILQEAMNTMTGTVLSDTVNRSIFQKRLHDFINNKEASFDRIAERICEAEHQLAAVSAELDLSNKRYQDLLDRQEIQLSRLEQIVDTQCVQDTQKITSPAHILDHLGFYANKQNIAFNQDYIVPQEVLSAC